MIKFKIGHMLLNWMVDQRFMQLQEALMDYRRELECRNPPQEHVPSQPIELVTLIEANEREGIIRKGQRVIEQGSGTGFAAILFNYRGYNVVGYELNRFLVEGSNELKERLLAKGLINSDLECEFRHGSYFPAQYPEVIRRQRANRIPTSKDVGAIIDPQEFDFLHIVPGTLTTGELRTYDIFYAYPWRVQMPSLVELFSLYARKDALLLFMLAGWPPKMDDVLKYHQLRKVGTNAFVKCN